MDINSSTANFQINGTVNEEATRLVMRVPENCPITTISLPQTQTILSKNLPTIFKCECFNDANKEFGEECTNTEIAHLFEHIMLEYLCIEKLASGKESAVYEGKTDWNWEKDSVGTFYVEIKVDNSEIEIIKKAFNKSVKLLKSIYSNINSTKDLKH